MSRPKKKLLNQYMGMRILLVMDTLMVQYALLQAKKAVKPLNFGPLRSATALNTPSEAIDPRNLYLNGSGS